MGTSSSFGGGKNSNPLIPTWLGDDGVGSDQGGDVSADPGAEPGNDDAGPNGGSDAENEASSDNGGDTSNEEAETASTPNSTNRYTGARSNFSTFMNSGGSERKAFGRAVSSYVKKTAGGAKTASRRMSAERKAATTLSGLLVNASTVGIREIAKSLNLGTLADRPVLEIYAALVDIICEPGGQLDDSMARDAYINAIGEVAEADLAALEHPSMETVALIMEHFITNTICDRIMNAIATQAITLPQDIETVQDIEHQLKDFVRGAVSDALIETGTTFTADHMKEKVDQLYERTFLVLQAMADIEVAP